MGARLAGLTSFASFCFCRASSCCRGLSDVATRTVLAIDAKDATFSLTSSDRWSRPDLPRAIFSMRVAASRDFSRRFLADLPRTIFSIVVAAPDRSSRYLSTAAVASGRWIRPEWPRCSLWIVVAARSAGGTSAEKVACRTAVAVGAAAAAVGAPTDAACVVTTAARNAGTADGESGSTLARAEPSSMLCLSRRATSVPLGSAPRRSEVSVYSRRTTSGTSVVTWNLSWGALVPSAACSSSKFRRWSFAIIVIQPAGSAAAAAGATAGAGTDALGATTAAGALAGAAAGAVLAGAKPLFAAAAAGAALTEVLAPLLQAPPPAEGLVVVLDALEGAVRGVAPGGRKLHLGAISRRVAQRSRACSRALLDELGV